VKCISYVLLDSATRTVPCHNNSLIITDVNHAGI
jgi:hypothetical protein